MNAADIWAGFARAALAAALLMFPTLVHAATIGIAAPLSGPTELLGRQIESGARAAADMRSLETLVIDDSCTEEGGRAAATRFAEARVAAVAGFLCTAALEAALPILREARIPVISPAVRTDSITDGIARSRFLFFRLAPRADQEAEAAARLVRETWRDQLFAVVDDGTIYGRELAGAVRFAAEQSGIKPVFVDTFRPQLENQIALVGRLRKAGATHVFAGGDRDDIAMIARDAARLDYPLVVAGGEALKADGNILLTAGMLMVALPAWADVAKPETKARLADAGIAPDGYVLPAYASVEILADALADAEADIDALVAALRETEFDTTIGRVKFDSKGDLSRNPFHVFRYDGTEFVDTQEQNR